MLLFQPEDQGLDPRGPSPQRPVPAPRKPAMGKVSNTNNANNASGSNNVATAARPSAAGLAAGLAKGAVERKESLSAKELEPTGPPDRTYKVLDSAIDK